MIIRLGYVAISKALDITSSGTITYTNYLKEENKNEKLDKIIKSNLENLEKILNYNTKNNIHFYRLTSKLIPLATHKDVSFEYINKYKDYYNKISEIINKNNMRVDVHADEFCVLNSINENVVLNSIKILNNLKISMDMFNVPYNIIIHIGSKANGVKESIKRFKNNFNLLNEDLKEKLIIENDDKNFNVYQTLKLCEDLNIPMCLDIHHHYCNKCTKNIAFYLPRILNTFKNNIPKMHYSSPKSKKEFRTHNEYINSEEFILFVNLLKEYNKDVDIMLEAKGKDLALVKLIYELKYKEIYKFIDESSFTL